MVINELILKNEKLSVQMKIFSEEIKRLEQLRDLFRIKSGEEFSTSPALSTTLNRKLTTAKEQFNLLNKAYDEIAHQRADINTPGFISAAASEIREIQEVFRSIRYDREV